MGKRRKRTSEELASRKRLRMIDKAREYQLGTYSRKFAAPVFQQMIRAEAAALPRGESVAIVDGELASVSRDRGQCVCITCGKVHPWIGGINRFSGMHTGHFLASRRNSILFEESNVAPQCSHCNYIHGGQQQLFAKWMAAVRGSESIERLESLKATVVVFSRDDLVDMRIGFQERLLAAKNGMLNHD